MVEQGGGKDQKGKKLIDLAAAVAGMPGGDFGADIIMGRGHGRDEYDHADDVGEVIADEIEVLTGPKKKS